MAISPYLRNLRAAIGNQLIVAPAVSVIPRDERGRVLLVQETDYRQWVTIGGMIEPDESPSSAALREAQEEAGVSLSLGNILAVLGGPQFRVTYPNGDITSYVIVVFQATVVGGVPQPDEDETCAVQWWGTDDLAGLELSSLTRVLLNESGITSNSS
jgi:8-oxo-dGTP pyrophosphatase MutT (NUDIX family)